MMTFNQIIRIFIGADVSALGSLHDIPMYSLHFIIGPTYKPAPPIRRCGFIVHTAASSAPEAIPIPRIMSEKA